MVVLAIGSAKRGFDRVHESFEHSEQNQEGE
jgi:hypothetical protein